MDDKQAEVVLAVAKEVAKDAYADAGKPIVKPTGELLGLIPRTIKAALLPLEKWILTREYNVTETQKLLEQKMMSVPPENIVTPDPYIAVPAMQYISYCMDNEELRDMYASLLANAMNVIVKDGVHPGFVEIIKQLCPDEAKILRGLKGKINIPTINIRFDLSDNSGIIIYKYFSTIGEETGCEYPEDINKYFDNLLRLGLVETDSSGSLINKELYTPLKNHPFVLDILNISENIIRKGYTKATILERYMYLTSYGSSFCDMCVSSST